MLARYSPSICILFDLAIETSLEVNILRISDGGRADEDRADGTETVKTLRKIPLSLSTLMEAGSDIVRTGEPSR